jgi:hypothetical protein
MMNRLFGFDRVWDVTSIHPTTEVGINAETAQPLTWVDLANAIQDYMAFESGPTGNMDVYDPVHDAILECIKLGSSILYNPWVSLESKDIVHNFDTGIFERGADTTVFDGLQPRVIPLEDFYLMPGYQDIHGPNAAPLVGHKYWLRKGQVWDRMHSGWFRRAPIKTVLDAPGGGDRIEEIKDHQSWLEGVSESFTTDRDEEYMLHDLWVQYDINDDNFEESLFVTFHEQTRKVCRIQPFLYKTRPYVDFHYVRREGRFHSIGVPEMIETIQRGINTSFNQTVDNVTIANVRAHKIKRGSVTARTLGNVYPGKKILVDNMDDIQEYQLGEVYPSAFQVGLLLRDFAERRTGVSDFNLGRESEQLGRSSTATTTMALLQESTRRFDLYSKNIRRAISELGMQSLELVQQMKPTGRIYSVMDAKGELVERALVLPENIDIREHLRMTTTSAAASSNKEVMRQNALAAFGLLTQYLERVFGLAQIMASPQIPEPLRKMAYDMSQTAERLMGRVLEGFDLPDIASFLPQLEGLLNAGQQPVQPPGPQGPVQPQGGVGVPGNGAPPPGLLGGLGPGG